MSTRAAGRGAAGIRLAHAELVHQPAAVVRGVGEHERTRPVDREEQGASASVAASPGSRRRRSGAKTMPGEDQRQDGEDHARALGELLVVLEHRVDLGSPIGELPGRLAGLDGDPGRRRAQRHQDQGGEEEAAPVGPQDEGEQDEERRDQEQRDGKWTIRGCRPSQDGIGGVSIITAS